MKTVDKAKLVYSPRNFESIEDPDSKSVSDIFRLRYWLAPYRSAIFTSIFFVVLSAIAAVMGPVIIARVIIDRMLLTTNSAAPDFGQVKFTTMLADTLEVEPILAACLAYALWVLIWVCCAHVFHVLSSSAAIRGLNNLRRDLFAHVEQLPAKFFDRNKTSQILQRITNDIENLTELFTSIMPLVGELVPLAIAASIMLTLDARLTAELSPFIVSTALIAIVFKRFSRPIYQHLLSAISRVNGAFYETIAGMEEVQLSRRETINTENFKRICEDNKNLEKKAIKIETLYAPIIDSGSFLAIGYILWLGGTHVLNNTATLGSIILFLQFTDMLFRPVVMLANQATVISRALSSCDRIFRLLDWQEPTNIPAQPVDISKILTGKIEFKNLNFHYQEGEIVIRDFSLSISPRESIAIVGATGSGKTTLTRLLCRFYDAPANSLYLDGIDITRIKHADLRKHIGIVFQDFHLFPGTVYENITLGDSSITREAARNAAEVVQALGFIEKLPEGFDTILLDQAKNLSRGQGQLLAFARVIARDPVILILDEATASIDPDTEAAIQRALSKIIKGRTTIIISHRLQTVRDVDRIAVLNHGRLIECGKHEELLALSGHYKKMWSENLASE